MPYAYISVLSLRFFRVDVTQIPSPRFFQYFNGSDTFFQKTKYHDAHSQETKTYP